MFYVDIDGVVIDSEPFFVRELCIFTGHPFIPPKPRTFDFRDGFPKGSLDLEDMLMIINHTLFKYHGMMPLSYHRSTALALELITHRFGKVNFITARDNSLYEITRMQIQQHMGSLPCEYSFVGHDGVKHEQMTGITHFIDDRFKNAYDVAKAHPDVKVFLLDRPWNQGREIEFSNCTRVKNLLEAVKTLDITL